LVEDDENDVWNWMQFLMMEGLLTGSRSYLGGPVRFSLYGSDSAAGIYGGMGVSSTWNSGYRVSDTAGAFANAPAPGFHALDSGGGLNITADGARLLDLNANQRLLVALTADYHHNEMDFGTSALTPGVASAGSVRRNTYTIAGSVTYAVDSIYLRGRVAADWSHADITNNVLQSQGDTNGRGYRLSGAIGKIFSLFNPTGMDPAMFVKAPPRSAGGYAVFLDVSGRLGYRNERDDGFTDTSGFIYGTEQLSYWTLGGRADLIAVIPNGRFSWMPYVGVTVDQRLGFSHTFDIPNQAATTADTFSFGEANTFWGVEAGLNVLDRGGIKAGMKAYYRASSDTSTLGGNLFLKIPFFDGPVVAAKDSGIRVLSK
jgi:hypothetical protein